MDSRNLDKLGETRELFDRLMFRVNTCIPGVIRSFDPETQTGTVQPAVQMRTMVGDEEKLVDLPEIDNVPIMFPFGPTAGFALTWPIRQGDSCLLVFSQRCIDNWHTEGGIQPPEIGAVGSRHHDLSDAFAFVCAPSIPEALPDWDDDGITLRSRNGNVKLTARINEIDAVVDNTRLLIKPTGVEITGNLKVTGDITATGNVADANGAKTMAGMRQVFNAHTHSGVTAGNTSTAIPGAQQ